MLSLPFPLPSPHSISQLKKKKLDWTEWHWMTICWVMNEVGNNDTCESPGQPYDEVMGHWLAVFHRVAGFLGILDPTDTNVCRANVLPNPLPLRCTQHSCLLRSLNSSLLPHLFQQGEREQGPHFPFPESRLGKVRYLLGSQSCWRLGGARRDSWHVSPNPGLCLQTQNSFQEPHLPPIS